MQGLLERLFMGPASLAERLFPRLGGELRSAYMGDGATEYLSKSIVRSLLAFATVSSALYAVLSHSGAWVPLTALSLGGLSAAFTFYWRLNLPRMIVGRRLADIERHLSYLVQSLYVQVSSGVSVFDSIVAVSRSGRGAVSSELKVMVDDVESGKPVVQAIEELASRNPSPYFQKVIWQIVSTLKTGGDMGGNLKDLAERLSRDQLNTVNTYGAKLSPLSMAYMMAAVIVPSLGITVLITLSSLPGMGSKVSEGMFWWILAAAVVVQVQFALLVKSARPNILG